MYNHFVASAFRDFTCQNAFFGSVSLALQLSLNSWSEYSFLSTLPVPAAASPVIAAMLLTSCSDSPAGVLFVQACSRGNVGVSSHMPDTAEKPHAIASNCCDSCSYMGPLLFSPPLRHFLLLYYSLAAGFLPAAFPPQCLSSALRVQRYSFSTVKHWSGKRLLTFCCYWSHNQAVWKRSACRLKYPDEEVQGYSVDQNFQSFRVARQSREEQSLLHVSSRLCIQLKKCSIFLWLDSSSASYWSKNFSFGVAREFFHA